MGFLSDGAVAGFALGGVTGGLIGGAGDSGPDADEIAMAQAIAAAKQRGTQSFDSAHRQYGQAYGGALEQMQPYDIGPQALQDYQQGNQGWMQAMDYTQSPIYQQLMSSGMDAVNQGAAGSGSLYSGARGEALRDVGQQAMLGANQQNMSAYTNYMSGLNNLMGIGQQTSANIGNLGLQRAGTMSDLGLQKADYLTGLEMGQAQTHMDLQSQEADRRQAMNMGILGMAGNVVGGAMGMAGGVGGGGQMAAPNYASSAPNYASSAPSTGGTMYNSGYR